jgi:sugar lactone lactonase YvrE
MQSIPNGRRWDGVGLRCALGAMSLAAALLPVLCQAQTAPTYTISAAVGTGTAGFSGDGAAAVDAEVNFPSSMVFDSTGNLYIADQANFRIRKVDTSGNISTIAGTGVSGDTGDKAAATKAELGSIGGIAVDSSGNIFLSDTANNVIRKIATTGIITVFAGTGTAGFSDDTTAYLRAYNKLNDITTVLLATEAKISAPTGIAVDSKGNVFFSDTGNNRIRVIYAADSTIDTIAGNGHGAYYGDGAGAIYSEINHPLGMVFDSSGNLYFADSANHRVRKLAATADGTITTDSTITTVAGLGTPGYADNGGVAVNAQLHYPESVALDSTGNLYIADFINNRVRMVNTSGVISTIAGSGKFGNTGDGGPALDALMYFPCGVAVDGSGNVYVIDDGNDRIRLLTPDATTGTTTGDSTQTGKSTPPVRSTQPVRVVRPVHAAQ